MEYTSEVHNSHISLVRKALFSILFVTVVSTVSLYLYTEHLNLPPEAFPVDADVVVEEGGTIHSVSVGLAEAHVVQSALYLYILLNLFHDDSFVQAGTYRFPGALTAKDIARAITRGEYQSPLLRVTFPEGFRAKDFFDFLPDATSTIPPDDLVKNEGYLFPDTYFLSPQSPAEDVIRILQNTFEEKIKPYRERIATSGMTEGEVIILASIIEREAKDTKSKHLVAGILHNRLREGMPLQVDATLDYILDKESSELTIDDLALDSPYNTYTTKGLPPTPISNPGEEAIEAVLSPTESDYLYYLTAPDGTFYYAKTFEEHKQNKTRYLR